ncbi:MAG: lipoyl(octanoyl) transferase LipB [Alphaproteobacteria bacterium]|nr:lipoyl(octanoyl) transferase LipB [Alphaproteobacteria bacterium]
MEWKISPGLTEYPEALAAMAARVSAIQRGEAEEMVWLVEHPPVYTLGTSAKAADILAHGDIPHYETGRGGQVTYHGPGQRVVYLLRDLKRHAGPTGPDLRAYVQQLEQWLILTLGEFGVEGFTREGRVGVWVDTGARGHQATAAPTSPKGEVEKRSSRFSGEGNPADEAKIAALGVRVQKWVTSHGVALNVTPDLSHYAGIVPCGIRAFGVTSLAALGVPVAMADVDAALREKFSTVFG